MVPLVHGEAASSALIPVGELSFNPEQLRLFEGSTEIPLRPKCAQLLRYLLRNRGRLISKMELISAIWPDAFVTENSLMQCMTELRRALGPQANLLKTFCGRGYLLEHQNSPRLERSNLACDINPLQTMDQSKDPTGAVDSLWKRRFELYLALCESASRVCNSEPGTEERKSAERQFRILREGALGVCGDDEYVRPAAALFSAHVEALAPDSILRVLLSDLVCDCRRALGMASGKQTNEPRP